MRQPQQLSPCSYKGKLCLEPASSPPPQGKEEMSFIWDACQSLGASEKEQQLCA